jgi:hypothetical protein
MKKQILYFASVALAAGLAACSNDELESATGYLLNSNELAATIEGAANTRTYIDTLSLKWTIGDEIGVFGENNKGNYKYTLVKGTGTAAGVFKTESKASFTPTTAYYPWSEAVSDIENGKYYTTLKHEVTYTKDKANEVKMPMVGTISGQDITFSNLTALFKITVVNMPKYDGTNDTYSAALINNDTNGKIAGSSVVNVSEKTLTVSSGSSLSKNYIVLKNSSSAESLSATKFTQGDTYDFYFIVPAGEYPDGLSFALGGASADYSKVEGETGANYKIEYTKTKNVKVNTIYKKILRFDAEGKLQDDGDVADYNEDLAAGNKTLNADLSETKGTLFIPTTESTSADSITINLTVGNGTSYPVSIVATDPNKETPKVHLNLTSAVNAGVLTLDLPKSSVTLAPATASSEATAKGAKTKAKTYDVTLAVVNSTTADDVLRIAKGVMVTSLVVDKGNVYVETDAAATVTAKTTTDNPPHYVFNQTGTDENGIAYATDATYKMMFPSNGAIIPVTDDTTLKQPITIGTGKTVTLNLSAALTASAADAHAIIVDGGTLNITGTEAGSLNAAASASVSTILIKSGTVNLENATIANAAGVAVELTGASAKFELKSGAVESTVSSSPVAIKAESGSSVTINNAESTITGGVTVNASSANVTAKSIGALVVSGTGANVTVDAPTVGGVTVSGGKAVVKATTLGETVAVSAGEAEITADNETASTTNFSVTATGKLTLKDGKISGTVTVEGTDAKNVGTFIVENGTISATTSKAAIITGNDHSVIEIQGGTIENATGSDATDVALALKSTSGIAKATISGESTKISSKKSAIVLTGASGGDATKTPALTVNGGTITSSDASSVVITDATGPADITINGGTIKNVTVSANKETLQGIGIKQTEAGSLAITGGTVQAATAVSLANGTLTVSGTNEVNILGTTAAVTASAGSVTLTNPNATYSVNSATATLYSFQGSGALTALSIENGNFNGNIIANAANIHFISGGTFTNCDGLRSSDNQIKYLKEGRKLQWNESAGYYTVVVE